MTEYVVGFIFDELSPGSKEPRWPVLLARKSKPDWQKGKLNGVGGRVEPGEDALAAMVREAREETGLKIPAEDWECFAVATGVDFSIKFFVAAIDTSRRHSTNEEPLAELYDDDLIEENDDGGIVSDLLWLVPLALDKRVLRPVRYVVK
jgi:8-oxo-dGTP diphosphatase